MTRYIPMSATELAKIAALGGQLGIAAKDIAPFVEVTAKMATTFDMTAEEAGTAIGKCRPPCFYSLAAYSKIVEGGLIANAVITMASLNFIAGEFDR